MSMTSIRLAAVLVLSCGSWAPLVSAGDLWVDSSQESNGIGSFADPFKRIGSAMNAAGPGDTIRVVRGDHDYNIADNNEVFPIVCKSGVRIVGEATDPQDMPRIGGDVTSPTVGELFLVQAADVGSGPVTVSGVEIRALWFVAQDIEDVDAPSAVRFATRGGSTLAGCGFLDNVVERGEMRDETRPDRAAVVVDAGWGVADVTLQGNLIHATSRGGIEQRVDVDADSYEHWAVPVTQIFNNQVLVEGADTAAFGIRVGGIGEAFTDPTAAAFTIRRNLVHSVGATGGGGIAVGIDIRIDVTGDGNIRFTKDNTWVIGNQVHDGTGPGIRVLCDGPPGQAYFSCWEVRRNVVTDNAGAGLEIDWGSEGTEGGGYLDVITDSNIWSGNGIGVHLRNGNGAGAVSDTTLVNDTIAWNASHGVRLDDLGVAGPSKIINCILYFNNGGGLQVGGSTPDLSGVLIEHNDWQGLWPLTGDNIDADPLFVNAIARDFHLRADSPCLDAGDDLPNGRKIGEFDFEGDVRQLDGPDPGTAATIDMGADEHAGGS